MKKLPKGIGPVTLKREKLEEMWDEVVEDVKDMNLDDGDTDNVFSVGVAMGCYWQMCELLDIDGWAYAKEHDLELMDM